MNGGNLKEGTEHFMLVQNWTADFEDAIQGGESRGKVSYCPFCDYRAFARTGIATLGAVFADAFTGAGVGRTA